MFKKVYSLLILFVSLVTLLACKQKVAENVGNRQSEESSVEKESVQKEEEPVDSYRFKLDLVPEEITYLTSVRDSEPKQWALSDKISSVVGTYIGYSSEEDGEITQVMTSINEDGTYTKIVTPMSTTHSLNYFNSSNQYIKESSGVSVNGKTYYAGSKFIFSRGIVVEEFDNLYLLSKNLRDVDTVIDQDGEVDYSRALINDIYQLHNHSGSILVEGADLEGFYELASQSYNSIMGSFVNKGIGEKTPVIQNGKFFESKSYDEIADIVMSKMSDAPDILTQNLSEVFESENIIGYFSDLNTLLQYGMTLGDQLPYSDEAIIEVIPQGEPIYSETDGNKYENRFGYTVSYSHGDFTDFYSYVDGGLISGRVTRGQYIGQNDSVFLKKEVKNGSELDLDAIAKGDLSSIVGTYQGLNGSSSTFTFNADATGSTTSANSSWDVTYGNFQQENGMVIFSASDSPVKYYVIPAGVETPIKLVEQWDDSSRNRIVVSGNGVNIFFF